MPRKSSAEAAPIPALAPTGHVGDAQRQFNEAQEKRAKAKTKSKTKYTCPSCDANAWAKPGANLVCGDCEETLEEQD